MLSFVVISLFVLALLLCLVEVFLLPGFGICGVISATCAIVGVGVVFVNYGTLYGIVASVVVLLLGIGLFYWVMHSKRIEKLSLHAKIDSSVANEDAAAVSVGDEGVALTRLALVGNALIGGIECEVRSAEGFIEEGTVVVVNKVRPGEIYVKTKR